MHMSLAGMRPACALLPQVVHVGAMSLGRIYVKSERYNIINNFPSDGNGVEA